jgi:putative component of toxin-antitoxin plasmid stabilization module
MAKLQVDIDFIAEKLRKGEKTQDIFTDFCEKLRKVSKRTFESRLSEAKKLLAEDLEAVRELVNEKREEIAEAKITALKSDLEIEEQLLKIGFGEMEIEERTDMPNGIVINTRRPTPAEMRAALAEVWKKRGVYAAEKVEQRIIVKVPDDDN